MKTSSDPRHQARRLALATLYFQKINQEKFENGYVNNLEEMLEISKYNKELYEKIIESANKNKDAIVESLEGNTSDWDLKSLFKIDLTILEIAMAELITNNTPHKVIIDEAIELSKEFSTQESSKFINGVLAGIIQKDAKKG